MGNICGTTSSHNVYSPPVSPRQPSGSGGGVHIGGGHVLTSVHQLPSAERERFLEIHDPMRRFGLNPDTPLYRTTDKKYVQGGKLAGNPESCARIALHEELQANPNARYIGAAPGEAHAYLPRQMHASDLKDPSLNVMVGSQARSAVRGYSTRNHVAVKMRLGDFLDKGGKVYKDVSSVASNGITANALIVTLPKNKKVRAQIIND
ncbi:AvrPphF family type III effector [Pseudomonas cucumis]|nr:AvrPphF family type III effector [Pseudomonas cucumis]WLG93315.1 AvrPphF family type III effector [Pseudomonas cucumis]